MASLLHRFRDDSSAFLERMVGKPETERPQGIWDSNTYDQNLQSLNPALCHRSAANQRRQRDLYLLRAWGAEEQKPAANGAFVSDK
jgi:hypothetical protein